jgi:manganese/zinc/iron transport system permease protein
MILIDSHLAILAITSLVAVSGAVLGTFLVLRRMAMMTDAISHSILFGIVVGFLIFRTRDSLVLIVASALTGLLTVWLTELILKTRLVKEDASIGLVFPLLFSIAVILIAQRISGLHLDIDVVLVGDVTFAPLDTISFPLSEAIFGAGNTAIEIPRALLTMGAVTLVNLAFVGLLYKELKLTTFDAGLAVALGFAPGVVNYALMGLLSVTAVGAFDAVGAVLFVAFVVTPASTAYLLTDKLWRMIGLAALIGVAACVAGYAFAVWADASISGCIVVALGAIFLVVLVVAPDRGLLAGVLRRVRQRGEFAVQMLVMHLMTHEGQPDEAEESALASLPHHLRWEPPFLARIVARAARRGWVQAEAGRLSLTERGRHTAQNLSLRIQSGA